MFKNCNVCRFSKYSNNGATTRCTCMFSCDGENHFSSMFEPLERDDSIDAKTKAWMVALEKSGVLIREESETSDMVNHPKHYKAKNGMEAIDVIEAFTDGLNGIEATDTGNIIKYALRWKDKNGVEDLKKIIWYATHLIQYLENNK